MTETIDLIELQKFANKGVPDIKEWETTFFDIAGFPHYENVVSNFYAYFLNPNEKHRLGSLFLDALQELIGTSLVFVSPQVTREYTTKSGNRIDIVVQDSDESGAVMIIENKMFHHLNNDLNDYYTEFNVVDEYKKGIVLTIKPTETGDDRFKNITHNQWLDKVWEMSGTMLFTISQDSLYHLKQFTTNLKNFNMAHEIGDYLDFYTENFTFIKKVENLKYQLEKYIWDEINRAWTLLPDLKLTLQHKGGKLTYYYNENKPHVFFTLFPYIIDENKMSLTIVVELNHIGIDNIETIKKIDFTAEERVVINNQEPKNKTWFHFASKDFSLTNNNVENLAEFIAKEINNSPLKTIYTKAQTVFAE